MNPFQEYCLRVFSKVNPAATFLSIVEYKNNQLEISNYSVVFHINYLNAIEKSYNILKPLDLKKIDLTDKLFSINELEIAREELLASLLDTLSGQNPLYTCSEVYSQVLDFKGNPVKGVKIHIGQNVLHINALKIQKKVLVPGEYKLVNSSGKTLAKKELRQLTPMKNWVQFKLIPEKFKILKVQKMVIDSGNK